MNAAMMNSEQTNVRNRVRQTSGGESDSSRRRTTDTETGDLNKDFARAIDALLDVIRHR